jgi:tetraacyldisaccharide 4'-kinase
VAARRIERRLVAPEGVGLVTVGGATLGGSGRTRLALAVTVAIAEAGVPVALVGHGYRAHPGHARCVSIDDALDAVGDEALACARALAGRDLPAEVVVAPRRAEAVAFAAARGARVVVLDGPLRTSPAIPDLALLALDPRAPWGAGVVVPAGDLRAPPDALLASADLRVDVAADPTHAVTASARGAVPLAELEAEVHAAGGRLGLFTAIARPDRLARALGRSGVVPELVVRAPDHGPVADVVHRALVRARTERNITTWLVSPKCAEHLYGRGLDLAVLIDAFALPGPVREALGTRVRAVAALTSAHPHALTPSEERP